jgi:hypothetical protein
MTTVRLWDKDFNLLRSSEGDVSDFFDGLTLTVDHEDGRRESGRFHTVKMVWA